MKKIFAIISTVLVCFLVNAQQQDNKAGEILSKVTEKTKSYESIKIDFTYTMENQEADINESKKGTIILKGNKFRLNIAGQLVFSDGETIWTYIKDAEEIQINSVEEDDESINLNKILLSYAEDYKSRFVKSTIEKGVEAQIIDLVPNEGKSYFKVRLVIDEAKAQIIKAVIYDKNGSTYSYLIEKFIPNQKVNDKDFSFNASDFPDAEVIDMR